MLARRIWPVRGLDVESKLFILKLVQTGSKVYADAFSGDLQWSECLLQNGLIEREPIPCASIACKSSPHREKPSHVSVCSHQQKMVSVCSHQRQMPCSGRSGPKHNGKIKCHRGMDVASFREIQRIQRLDNDEFFQNRVAGGQCRQKTHEEWNRFWSKAAKVERKKRKKPLTVSECKERRKKKLWPK